MYWFTWIALMLGLVSNNPVADNTDIHNRRMCPSWGCNQPPANHLWLR